VGIPKFRAIGKTDGACFIKKSAKEKDNIQFYERSARTWVLYAMREQKIAEEQGLNLLG
jgi:hypothetical protein